MFLGDSNYSSVCIASSSSSSSKCCCCIETMVSKVGSRAWVMCFFFLNRLYIIYVMCLNVGMLPHFNLDKSNGVEFTVTISSYNKVVKNSLNFSPVISGSKYLAARLNLFLSPNGDLAASSLACS